MALRQLVKDALFSRGSTRVNRIAASVLFAMSSVAPLFIWKVLLFSGVPSSQGSLEHAASLLELVFSDPALSWFYSPLAVLPLLLVYLSAVAWRHRDLERTLNRSFLAVSSLTTLVALVCVWPAAIGSVVGAYHAYRHHGG